METTYVKKSGIGKYVVYVLLAAVAAGIAFYFYAPKPVNNAAIESMNMFIQNKIADIDEKLANGNDKADIATRLSWHKSNTALYEEVKTSKDAKVKEQREVLKTKMVRIQAREFPALRTAYVESKKEVLGPQNIKIEVSGEKKDVLTFTGSIFQPEQTQKGFMKNIHEIITDLRFKQVVYKWSDNTKDVADYKIDSKNDVEI
jgi:restriction endonuclease Mrr